MGDRNNPFRILLCSVLMVAMVTGAFAHGYARARDADPVLRVLAVVLCADGGTRTILLDPEGAPVDPSRCLREMCSACLTPQFLASDNAPMLPDRVLVARRAANLPAAAAPPALQSFAVRHPRAPPFLT